MSAHNVTLRQSMIHSSVTYFSSHGTVRKRDISLQSNKDTDVKARVLLKYQPTVSASHISNSPYNIHVSNSRFLCLIMVCQLN